MNEFSKIKKTDSKNRSYVLVRRAPSWLKKGNPVFLKKEISYTLSNGNKLVYGTINFNQIAEKDMVDVISYLVNGGNNGLYERRKYVDILKKIFNYENCTNN